MANLTTDEILYFLSNRYITEKTNNYLFDNMTVEQMKEIREFLKTLPISPVNCSGSAYESITTTQNILYDCNGDSIDSLLDWKTNWRLPIKSESFITVHILNLQLLSDITKLQLLNQSVLKVNSEKMCFHLYTTDGILKTYFTPTGQSLDSRNDLLLFRENKGITFR